MRQLVAVLVVLLARQLAMRSVVVMVQSSAER
jgi:hypothetical protein